MSENENFEIKRVAVIGVGAIGSGIAYICAMKGYEVTITDVSEEILKLGVD